MPHRNAPLTETGRLRLARCVVEQGWPLRRAAERFQVSHTTAKRWADRYRAQGAAGMVDRSSRPHRCPRRTPAPVEGRVLQLRARRRWGPARIGGRLGLPASTCHAILRRAGGGPDGPTLCITQHCSLGSAVSPVLANLFLHYAFDAWMAREYPGVPFERYVDDAVVHCVSERQAHRIRAAIADRMEQVGLRLHPTKTRIVYCKDGDRRGSYDHTSFAFLGFTFRARAARSRHGVKFTSFLPAISIEALKKISGEVRRWRLHRKTPLTIGEIAKKINPIVRGWIQYYGAFYRSALCPLLGRINAYLVRWIRKK